MSGFRACWVAGLGLTMSCYKRETLYDALYGGCPIFLHLESGACAVLARSLRELARAQFGSKCFSFSLITLTL